MMPRSLLCLAAGAALLAIAGTPPPAQGCVAVAGRHVPVQIADEEAIIVWDAARHREDFVRRATFQTRARDFGFLVPTPSVPVLAAADPAVFGRLESLTNPPAAGLLAATHGLKSRSLALGVHVLRSQRVGGYQAVVLSASDAGALARWLQTHGYTSRPAIRAWLAPYVREHWKITAFKIAAAEPGAPRIESSAVRMSFTTARPFFPYREPADQRTPGTSYPPRLLRLFLLAGSRMQGAWSTPQPGRAWPGIALAAVPVAESGRAEVARGLALRPGLLPAALWLTRIEDRSSPRPGIADVVFRPAPRTARRP